MIKSRNLKRDFCLTRSSSGFICKIKIFCLIKLCDNGTWQIWVSWKFIKKNTHSVKGCFNFNVTSADKIFISVVQCKRHTLLHRTIQIEQSQNSYTLSMIIRHNGQISCPRRALVYSQGSARCTYFILSTIKKRQLLILSRIKITAFFIYFTPRHHKLIHAASMMLLYQVRTSQDSFFGLIFYSHMMAY